MFGEKKGEYVLNNFVYLFRKTINVWPKAGVVPRDLFKRVRREEKGQNPIKRSEGWPEISAPAGLEFR